MRPDEIADIHIGRVYDPRDPEGDVHYETFARLAAFFGRNTPVHRHHSFYQIHVLVSGAINLDLDGAAHAGPAPALIFTPPTVPHAFYSDDGTDGHVLTIRQDVVRDWCRVLPGGRADEILREPAFLSLAADDAEGRDDFAAAVVICDLVAREFAGERIGRTAALKTLADAFLVQLVRLFDRNRPATSGRSRTADVSLFMKFCDLVEARFRDHPSLAAYAADLAVTEARLNDVCRRIAGTPPKEIVHDRLTQEARRLLHFTDVPIAEIGWRLGFADPAYFSRFFTRRTGRNPSSFRSERPIDGGALRPAEETSFPVGGPPRS